MGLFGPTEKVRKRDAATALRDSKIAAKESAELRRQIARNMISPARITDKEISGNMARIDRQLVYLEKLRHQIDTNRVQYGQIASETARLREQRRGLRRMQKAKKHGIHVSG